MSGSIRTARRPDGRTAKRVIGLALVRGARVAVEAVAVEVAAVVDLLEGAEEGWLVADRIVRFAKMVGRENVIAGTDCGFAQLETVQRVHPQVMWAKLEALVEGALIASRELW